MVCGETTWTIGQIEGSNRTDSDTSCSSGGEVRVSSEGRGSDWRKGKESRPFGKWHRRARGEKGRGAHMAARAQVRGAGRTAAASPGHRLQEEEQCAEEDSAGLCYVEHRLGLWLTTEYKPPRAKFVL